MTFGRRIYQRPAQVFPAPIPPDRRRGVILPVSPGVRAVPKAAEPVRDPAYRRLVAALPCFHCRIEQHSQAAHPNTGKAKGKKLCDLLCFPLCTVRGRDCHGRFDLYRLIPRSEMSAFERRAYAWTVKALLARGEWPMRLPVPDLREFH